jgi:hypothetical protein
MMPPHTIQDTSYSKPAVIVCSGLWYNTNWYITLGDYRDSPIIPVELLAVLLCTWSFVHRHELPRQGSPLFAVCAVVVMIVILTVVVLLSVSCRKKLKLALHRAAAAAAAAADVPAVAAVVVTMVVVCLMLLKK